MSNNSKTIRFFTYSQFHGKQEPVGSTYLRVNQLIKYWPEAELYKYGENPDVMIFQKVFCSDDYQFPKHLKATKILDICDPMWLEGANIVETSHAVDAVTCSSEGLAEYMRQFCKKVIVVPDRFDLELIPKPKPHYREAQTVVWFGYSHNAELLKPAMPLLDSLGLNLTIISNDDPFVHRWSNRQYETFYKFVKYNEATIYSELQKADFALLPDGNRPIDIFKSNNKTIKAQLAGLPVAKTPEEVEAYMKAVNRQKWVDDNLEQIMHDYDVKRSVEQYKELIDDIQKN